MPGRADEPACWIPIDAKFPVEEWERLQDALERADGDAAEAARKALAGFLRQQARTVRENYVSPPHTSDFAFLYLPTESLYAEMMARAGLADELQREHRVMIAGPSNFLALLNIVQMGFRTVAIEQRSSEVWLTLGAVRTEFRKFGDVLTRAQKKLQEASNTIEEARGKTTTIARKLRDVEGLPENEADRLLTAARNRAASSKTTSRVRPRKPRRPDATRPMWSAISRWRRRRILRRTAIPDALWREATALRPFLAIYDDDELRRLREKVVLFLHAKAIVGARGHEVTPLQRVVIAIEACVLVLELDIAFYDGFENVIVYPGEFVPDWEWEDEAGVVHRNDEPMAGEAMPGGPSCCHGPTSLPAPTGRAPG